MIFLKWIQLAMTLVVKYQYCKRKIIMNLAYKLLGLNSDFQDHFTLSKIVLILLKIIFIQEFWLRRTSFCADGFDEFNF